MRSDSTLSRRGLLVGAPALAAALAPAAAAAVSGLSPDRTDDPIFAAINAHREAFAKFGTAVDSFGWVDFSEDENATKQAEDSVDVAGTAEMAALDHLVETVPSAPTGLRTMIDYVVAYYTGETDPRGHTHELLRDNAMVVNFLTTVRESAAALMGGGTVSPYRENDRRRMADDPIFAVIEEYKRAERTACDIQLPVDEAEFLGLKNSGRPTEEWLAWFQEDPEGYQACREQAVPAELAARNRAAKEAYAAAIDGMGETRPTTIAGAATLLTFWIEDDPLDNGEMCWHRPALHKLAEALERLAAT
jgi:hypothetical protein